MSDDPYSNNHRYIGGFTTTHDGMRVTYRGPEGEIRSPLDHWPSDAVLGKKLAKLVNDWAKATDEHRSAKAELANARSDKALRDAEKADERAVAEAAREGKDYAKVAEDAPNVAALDVRRRVAPGAVAVTADKLREATAKMLEGLNDQQAQADAVERADAAVSKASDEYEAALKALTQARNAWLSAHRDRHVTYEWADKAMPAVQYRQAPRPATIPAPIGIDHDAGSVFAAMAAEIRNALAGDRPRDADDAELGAYVRSSGRKKALNPA